MGENMVATKDTMTVEEVLEVTINNLTNLHVPVALAEEIAIPIKKNAINLQLCLNALREQRAAEESVKAVTDVKEGCKDEREADV